MFLKFTTFDISWLPQWLESWSMTLEGQGSIPNFIIYYFFHIFFY
jgi:hypothetical protein